MAEVVRSQLVGPLATEAGARQHGAVPRGGTEFPSHACRYEEPWFGVAGSRKQVRTYAGTRPGDPLAEVVFDLTFLSFQTSLEQFLVQVGASVRVPRRLGGIFGTEEQVQETLPCPANMDDLRICSRGQRWSQRARLAFRRILASSSIWRLTRRRRW